MLRVVFTSSSGFVSAAIRWITRSRASHVGLQIDLDRVIHADIGGVLDDTMSGFLAKRKLLAAYELKHNIEAAGTITRMLAHVGQNYDFDGMIWNIVPILSWRWFKVRLGNPLADQNEFWCSEYVVTALREFLGPGLTHLIPEIQGLDAEVVTPGGLQRRIARGSSFVRVNIGGWKH